MMEEEEGNGGATPALEPRRHELLAAAVGEDNTPAAAVSTHMNFDGSREFFFEPPPPPSDGGARSSAGECAAAAAINLLTPQSIMGLSLVSAAGAAAQSAVNKAAAGAARGGRNAELQSKGRHSDNAFRLDPGHCHHLSNPDVLIAYNKWATNQSTGKKAPYWAFYDELKVAVGKYPPIWRCVGCHPVASAALALYEQKKELKAMPKGLVRYG
jgi:hypothetical protein